MSRVVWYFAEKGETHGPLAWDGLQAAVQEGRLTKAGSVWSPGVDDWVPSVVVPWLIHATAAPIALREVNAGPSVAGAQHLVTSPPPVKSVAGWRWQWPSATSPVARFGLQRAALSHRVLAAAIDLLLSSLIGAGVALLAGYVMRIQQIGDIDSRYDGVGAIWLVSLLLYHVAFESLDGKTVGKRFMNCRLVDAKGEPPFATRVVARVILRFVVLFWAINVVYPLASIALVTKWTYEFTASNMPIALVIVLLADWLPLFIGERRPLHDILAGCWLVNTSAASEKSTE